MNSFEGHPIIITEQRYQELIEKEKSLEKVLKSNPELTYGTQNKLTPTAKKYKKAFSDFLDRVEHVLACPEMVSMFTVSALHGIEYKGPTLAKEIAVAKQVLGR